MSPSIDYDAPTPPYQQIAAEIIRDITSGTLAVTYVRNRSGEDQNAE